MPAVLDAPGAVVATSNKADLWAATAALRESVGMVWTFDPQGIARTLRTWWWDPIRELVDVEAAERLASHFVLTVEDDRSRDIWGPAAQELADRDLLAVYGWLSDERAPEPVSVLRKNGLHAPADRHEGKGGSVNDDELQAYLARLESDLADLGLAVQELRGELADAVAGGNVKAAEPSFADLEEWVVTYLSGTFARPVSSSWRWCAQWWDHAEAGVRLKALFVAYREAQQTGRMLAWLRDLDQQLAVLTDAAGTFGACTPERHYPPQRLPCKSPPAESGAEVHTYGTGAYHLPDVGEACDAVKGLRLRRPDPADGSGDPSRRRAALRVRALP